MKHFTVLGQRPGIQSQEDLFAIRDGFSFFAFIVPPLWFLWRGMWLHAGISLMAFLVVSLLPLDALQLVLSLLIAFWVGFEARFFYLEFLQKQGLVVLARVSALNSEMARDIYLAEQPKSHMKVVNPILKTKPSPQQADMVFGRN
ncbi:DUF2628 domain-containing protein [Lentilitoribacter sp. EG35]|uniref:DUF2628 domain-containing protein n=1 Tax=Lentilitoribacter sp. EG35 TaxID=3234192 RepID=UPI0034609983